MRALEIFRSWNVRQIKARRNRGLATSLRLSLRRLSILISVFFSAKLFARRETRCNNCRRQRERALNPKNNAP